MKIHRKPFPEARQRKLSHGGSPHEDDRRREPSRVLKAVGGDEK